ncbi:MULTISPECIES: hypothetical protein [unclassified Halomonas]
MNHVLRLAVGASEKSDMSIVHLVPGCISSHPPDGTSRSLSLA